MDNFYNLIKIIASLGYESHEDERKFTIDFNYHKELSTLFTYEYLEEIKKILSHSLNLFMSLSKNNEIDVFDFLDDRNEFDSEIKKIESQSITYKLIFNKEIFIRNKIENLKDSKLVFFVDKKNFLDYLHTDISIMESTIFKENKKNIFILGNSNVYMHNDYFMITNIKRTDLAQEIIEYDNNTKSNIFRKNIEKRNELCNWVDGSHFLTPESLYINLYDQKFLYDDDIVNLLCKMTTDLVIPFISNFTGYVDNKFISIINGNKRVEIDYSLNVESYSKESYKKLFDLYSWIYDKSAFDKVTVCRNVISVLISAKCQGSTYKTIIDNSDWLIKSVQDNFEEFLQNNIETYFKEKNSIIDKLTGNINEINNQISELTKLTITNITSLLGTALAAVIGYIAKGDYTFIRLLSFLYLCYLIINSVFNLPISVIRVLQIRNDFNLNKELYLKLYPNDERIKKMEKRNKFNSWLYFFYTASTLILIIGLIYFVTRTDISSFIAKFS